MFTIPNHEDANHPNPQSIWMQADIEALLRALGGTCWVSGCAVTERLTPSMSVAVASGVVNIAGVATPVTGANATIGAAHATDTRIDLISIDSLGAIVMTAGTAVLITLTAGPKAPNIPANSVLLAMVVVLPAATAVYNAEITDKRCPAPVVPAHNSLTGLQGGTASEYYHLTSAQNAAAAGTSGSPSGSNKYVTDADARMTNARTPSAHHTSHEAGGGDGIKLDDLVAPDDNTDLDASTTKHGLSPKATAPASGLLSVLAIGNGETVRTDKAIFDTTNPAALGTAAPGTALVAARRDHVHALPAIDATGPATDITTRNMTTSAHGLQEKAVNDPEKVYLADATQGYAHTLKATNSASRVILPVGVDKWAT